MNHFGKIIDYTNTFGMGFRNIEFLKLFIVLFSFFLISSSRDPFRTSHDPQHACMLSRILHPPSSTFTRSSRGTLKGN